MSHFCDGRHRRRSVAGHLAIDGSDRKNRLIQVDYASSGAGVTQVAAFEYDALGRMISSRLQYDAETSGEVEHLKFYHDGQNVLAEYDVGTGALSRRYIHGTNRIDERAALLAGEPDDANGHPLDVYYYLLRELDTVTGLMTNNGALAEAYTYDAYGKVSIYTYLLMDFDRFGDVENDDLSEFFLAYPSAPAIDPMADPDGNGSVDVLDFTYLSSSATPSGEPPVHLFTSGVGNPYFFTGRRLHFLERDLTGQDPAENKQIQYNRARHYDPEHGRWLQRDPSGYTDGMNLYEYVRSNPARFSDPYGLSVGPAGYAIKNAALSTIGNISTAHASQTYYQVTGLNSALRSMASEAGRATFHDRTKHWFKSTPMVTSSGQVYLSPGEAASQTTVFHEMTHLLQVRVRGGFGSPARDEGEATAAEMMLVKLTSLIPLEKAIKQRAAQSNCGGIARKWSAAAFSFNNVLGTQTQYGTVTAGDIGTMRGLTGFGLNCKRLVQRYNGLMRSSGYFKKPCCLQPLNCSQFNPAFR